MSVLELCRAAVLVVAASILSASAVAAQRRPIALADLGREVSIKDAILSPDARRVAAVISRQDFIDNRHVATLVLIETTTGAQRELTPGRSQVSAPAWSPDGDRLAWLDTDRDGKAQIYVRAAASHDDSALAVTATAQGVNAFRWSPDGATIAFSTCDLPEPRTGEERHNKSFEVGDNDFLTTAPPTPSHLWVVGATGGQTRRLSSGQDSITGFDWIDGGRALTFVSQKTPHSGERSNSVLGRIELRDGARQVLVPASAAGSDAQAGWPSAATKELNLLDASPDGRWVAFGRSRGPQPSFWPAGVYVVPTAGGAERNLTATLDYSFWKITWLPASQGVLVTANAGTRTGLWLQPLEGPPRRLDVGELTQLGAPSVSRTGALVYIGSTSRRAREIYFMASVDARPKQLTRFNEALSTLELGRVETMSWTLDGFEEDGVLIYPPGFEPGRKYPLVLDIHGGPMAAYTEAFNGFGQLLAAQGWVVFQPNYRGSNHRGARFQSAIINDAGDGPGRDVMAGLAAVQARGIVDERRMAVSGFSYGGFMTVWLSAHYPVWRSAVAGAAVTNWIDAYNLSDINVFFGEGLNGSPWRSDNAANYWRQSPIAYAHQIRAPTLILANTGDRRVPISQSFQLYHALKDNGVPVQFIAYPVAGHGLPDPVHQRDNFRRQVDWISEHFRDGWQ